jgi:hypothetical protein
MFAFEIYGKREDLYTTHFNSPAMKEFLPAIPDTMTTGLDLRHYEDVGGFLDRFNDRRECEIMTDVRINCKAEARNNVLSKLNTLAEKIKSDGSGDVYTFFVLKGLDDDQGVRIFQRFRTWDGSSSLARDQAVLEFWMSSKEEILSMESQTYFPNGKGWLHRG